MANAVYETIKESCQLPSPTGVALEILRLADDLSTTSEKMASTVEADPALAGRLLKLVNAPFAGQSRRVSSIPMAVSLLGMKNVKAMALGFSLINAAKPECPRFDHDLFWSTSLARAVSCRHIAGRTRATAPDVAFTCGLLSRVGQLALATAFPQSYDELLSNADLAYPQQLAVVEREIFEIDHNGMTAALMADWHLPAVFYQVVEQQDDQNLGPDSGSLAGILLQILRTSELVASVIVEHTVYRESLAELTREANSLGIRPDLIAHVFDSIADEWREASSIFSLESRKVLPLAEIYALARDRRRKIVEADQVEPATAQ